MNRMTNALLVKLSRSDSDNAVFEFSGKAKEELNVLLSDWEKLKKSEVETLSIADGLRKGFQKFIKKYLPEIDKLCNKRSIQYCYQRDNTGTVDCYFDPPNDPLIEGNGSTGRFKLSFPEEGIIEVRLTNFPDFDPEFWKIFLITKGKRDYNVILRPATVAQDSGKTVDEIPVITPITRIEIFLADLYECAGTISESRLSELRAIKYKINEIKDEEEKSYGLKLPRGTTKDVINLLEMEYDHYLLAMALSTAKLLNN